MGSQSWIWLRNFQDCSKIAFTPILLGVQEKVNPGRGDINVEREGINKSISALLVCLLFLLFSPLVVSNSAALWTATPQASPVLYYLPEFAQAHVHRVSDAIQPSHLLFPPSPPILNLSQHQGFFQWVSSSHQVAKVLELQFQHQSFQWVFRVGFL